MTPQFIVVTKANGDLAMVNISRIVDAMDWDHVGSRLTYVGADETVVLLIKETVDQLATALNTHASYSPSPVASASSPIMRAAS